MEYYNGRPINDAKRSEMKIRTYDFLDKILQEFIENILLYLWNR